MNIPYAYHVTILFEDLETLYWLSARGYDGGFLDMSGDSYESLGGETFAFTEPEAWQFRHYVESDYDAFLACCDSQSLASALYDFYEEIV